MKILMLAQDPNICVAASSARKRMERYAEPFDELHVVILTGTGFQTEKIGQLFLYPTAVHNPVLRRWRMYTQTRSLAARVRFDVITSQAPDEVGCIAYRIARRFHIKLQLQVHTDVLSPWYWRASRKEYFRALLAQFLLPRANCLRVVSERIKRSLMAKLGIPESRICVLPICTDLEPFRNAAPKSKDIARLQKYTFRMIAVGRFVDKEKNFSMLIDMMAEFVKREPAAVLVLVGDGPDKENFKFQISKFKLEKNVFIEPWHNDLASFYKCFDVVLISSNYEGWGLVAVEAMAAGAPLVMTDVGLAGEIVRDGANGRVVPVGDRDAFLDAVLDLHRHPEKRRALAEAARQTLENMKPRGWNEYLEQYRKSFDLCTAL